MMLHPSYKELMEKVNEAAPEGEKIVNSRYSIVMGTSKRARQITSAREGIVEVGAPKALSVAVDELDNEKFHILKESSDNYESYVADENGKV